jgi:hypothetical protein
VDARDGHPEPVELWRKVPELKGASFWLLKGAALLQAVRQDEVLQEQREAWPLPQDLQCGGRAPEEPPVFREQRRELWDSPQDAE